MRWRKLGLLYAPDGTQSWARTHAMIPTPLWLSPDTIRLYLAHADESVVSRIGYLDMHTGDPLRVIARAEQPVLDIGEPGTFDDNGVNACCVIATEGVFRLYYVGYQLQRKVPYTLFTGLAVSETRDGPFRRISRAPILDRTDDEPYFRTAPFVLWDEGRWRMWYVGGGTWIEKPGKTLPTYGLRHIDSDDGIHWCGPSRECLPPNTPDEIGLGRPFVVRDGPLYRMWYSIRKLSGYSVGYAISPDGLSWTRQDKEAGIERSESGWDSEMICYTAIVPTDKAWLMFYNGNGYGRTGVGVAVAPRDGKRD